MNSKDKVENYLTKNNQWLEGLVLLRKIMLDCGLEEDYKWSLPTYTYEGKNIAGLGATKNYLGIWFFQGGLLEDKRKLLVNAQEGKTKAMRQWRFNHASEINVDLCKQYIKEAIKNAREGREIKPSRGKKLIVPPLLKNALQEDKALDSAFEKLSLTKKRDFAEFIETAKREETKINRLEKIIPMIMKGAGLNDKYK